MNRLILKYGYPITAVILAIFAWVVYRRVVAGSDMVALIVVAVVVWAVGTWAFIFFWPRLVVGGFKRAILKRGLGGGPIPVNSLYATPDTSSPTAAGGGLMATGTNDLLYIGGWLDLRNGPQVLHVPDMAGRYYSLQFTDPTDSANFAYVGTRATGTRAGAFLLTGPGWKGTVPLDMNRISLPHRSALVIGRVFVASESDLPTAYGLAQQIRLEPLGR